MNSRAIFLKEQGSCCNYLSMPQMVFKECLEIFSFSLGQYLSSPGTFAANVISVYQGSQSDTKDFWDASPRRSAQYFSSCYQLYYLVTLRFYAHFSFSFKLD
jgi:hypothetical protein